MRNSSSAIVLAIGLAGVGLIGPAAARQAAQAGGRYDTPTVLEPGRPVESALDAGDDELALGRFAEFYKAAASAEAQTLRVTAADTALIVYVKGEGVMGAFKNTNVVVPAGQSRTLAVPAGRVNRIDVLAEAGGATGRYALALVGPGAPAAALTVASAPGPASSVTASAAPTAAAAPPAAWPAGVPAPLNAGDVVKARLDQSSPQSDRGARHLCRVLDTAPGSGWEIELKGERPTRLKVGRGGSCERPQTWDLNVADNGGALLRDFTYARTRFTAAGGAYLVMAQFNDGGAGAYTLKVKAAEPGGPTLAAAPDLQQVAELAAVPPAFDPALWGPYLSLIGKRVTADGVTYSFIPNERKDAVYLVYDWGQEGNLWAILKADPARKMLVLGLAYGTESLTLLDFYEGTPAADGEFVLQSLQFSLKSPDDRVWRVAGGSWLGMTSMYPSGPRTQGFRVAGPVVPSPMITREIKKARTLEPVFWTAHARANARRAGLEQQVAKVQRDRARNEALGQLLGGLNAALDAAAPAVYASAAETQARLDATLADVRRRAAQDAASAPAQPRATPPAPAGTVKPAPQPTRPAPPPASTAGGSGRPRDAQCHTAREVHHASGILWAKREDALASLMDHPNASKFYDVQCTQPSDSFIKGDWKCTAKWEGEEKTHCRGGGASRQ